MQIVVSMKLGLITGRTFMLIANKQHLSSFESVLFSAEEVGFCNLNRILNICSGGVGSKRQE